MLQQLIPLVVKLSLAGLVMAVGLEATPRELLSLFRQPLRLARAVLAVNVIVPVTAAILVGLFPLSPVVKMGILVMAVSPVPPLVPGKGLKAGGDRVYALSLYASLVLLSIVIVPATVAILAHIYGSSVSVSPLQIAENVAIGVVAPLLAGLALHAVAPAFSEKVAPTLRRLSMLVVLLIVIPVIVSLWPAISTLAGDGALLAMALTSAAGLAAGHLLGGPGLGDRGALAQTAVTRHPGIAILIANAAGGDKRVTAAVIAFMLVGLLVAIPYQVWLGRRMRAA